MKGGINQVISDDIIKEIENIISDRGKCLLSEPMDRHSSFRAGGCADVFVKLSSTEILGRLIKYLKNKNRPFTVIGNGSNILVSDKGYRGVIVSFEDAKLQLEDGKEKIRAGAGISLNRLSLFAFENSLEGLEFASGIPGKVGGALYMNAGAYGGEMKDVVESVKAVDFEDDDVKEIELSVSECEFGYRTSVARRRRLIFTEAVFSLKRGDSVNIKSRMDELAERRKEKQPLDYPNAGSTFKRPEGYFAGKLIMDAGLKGYSIGGAQVSEKHCGFVINKNGATASDIYKLTEEIIKRVKDNSGVTLEREVILLGDF